MVIVLIFAAYNDPFLVYENFLKNTRLFTICAFPWKKVKAKSCTLFKPWLTKSPLDLFVKGMFFTNAFLIILKEDFSTMSYKNKLSHSLRINVKRLYYGKKIEETNLTSFFKVLNEELFDPTSIAEQFCKYYHYRSEFSKSYSCSW